MRAETFYIIISENFKFYPMTYNNRQLATAREEMMKLARMNLGTKYHLMKRISSVIDSDLTWKIQND